MPSRYVFASLLCISFLDGCNRETTPTPAKQNSTADSSTQVQAKSDQSTKGRSGEPQAKSSAASETTDGDKELSAAAPNEESVVPYDSKTNGALQVMTLTKGSDTWFDVQQNGKRPFPNAPPLLNSTLEIAPGIYEVNVNHTHRKVTIAAGKKTVLWTGELMVVDGKKEKGGFYAPFQGDQKKVTTAEPLVNSSTPLFAGKYSVMFWGSVRKNLGEAEVKAGQLTRLDSDLGKVLPPR
jgi:hypothetical protein